MSAAGPSAGPPAGDAASASEPAASRQPEELCPVCHGSLTGQGSLHQQPLCGHKLHEKCWHEWVLTSTADPLRCLSCLRPVDQKNVQVLVNLALELLKKKAVEECQEHLQQLLVLGESQVLLEEAEQESPEALLHTQATGAVLFAYYLSGLLRVAQASPGSFSWWMAWERLSWLQRKEEPERSWLLAALVWEVDPEQAAQLPLVAQVLKLQQGRVEAHGALAVLYAESSSPFTDIGKAVANTRRALEHGGVGAFPLLPDLVGLMCRVVKAKDVELCQKLLQHMLVLGESQALLEEAERESPEALLHTQATRAVLLGYYLFGLIREAQASPGSFDWEMASQRLSWHQCQQEPEHTLLLAALVWEVDPEQAAQLPLVARLLKLQQGRVEAYGALEVLYAESPFPFKDIGKAVANIRRVLEHGGVGAFLLLPDLVGVMCEIFEAKDVELCQELLQQLLILGEPQALLEDSERESPEALLHKTATRVVLFAHCLLGLLREVQASPGSFDWELAKKRLQWLQQQQGLEGTQLVACLVWVMDPNAANMPIVARALKLEEGYSEASRALASLFADPESAFWDLPKALTFTRQAQSRGEALSSPLRLLQQRVRGLWRGSFQKKDLELCQKYADELQVVRTSHVLLELDSPGAAQPLSIARAVLFTFYESGLLGEAEASPATFDWQAARQRFQWLVGQTEVEQMKALAALVWERMPQEAAKLPGVADVLQLDQGLARAHRILGTQYSIRPFKDSEKAAFHFQRARLAKSQGDTGALLAAPSSATEPPGAPPLTAATVGLLAALPASEPQPAGQHERSSAEPLSAPSSSPVPGQLAPEPQPQRPEAQDHEPLEEGTEPQHHQTEAQDHEPLEPQPEGTEPQQQQTEAQDHQPLEPQPDGTEPQRQQTEAQHHQSPVPEQRPPEPQPQRPRGQELEPQPDGTEPQQHQTETQRQSATEPLILPPSEVQVALPAPTECQEARHSPFHPQLPLDIVDEKDLDLQIALDESLQEQRDPLQAVRNNPIMMQRQADLLPDVEEQTVQEELFLLQFQRSSPESMQRLHQGDLLQPCREALEEAGCPWLLDERGVKVFVRPCQYDLALRLLRQHPGGLFPRHVVVTATFLPVVLRALEGCAAGAGKLKSTQRLGEVPLPAESEEPETQTLQSDSQGGCGHRAPMPGGSQEQPDHAPNSQSVMVVPGEEDAPQPVSEALYLLRYQRNSKDFKKRLHGDARLQPCRQALEAAGCRWLLEDEEVDIGRFGVKVFVHPTQYYLALELLRRHKTKKNLRLFRNHVVVSESFLQLVKDSLAGCSGGGGTLKERDGQVKIGEVPVRLQARMEEAGMETRGTGLNTKRQHRRHPVNKSTGTASNPRRRKPDFKVFSLSSSSQVSIQREGQPSAGRCHGEAEVAHNQAGLSCEAMSPNLCSQASAHPHGPHHQHLAAAPGSARPQWENDQHLAAPPDLNRPQWENDQPLAAPPDLNRPQWESDQPLAAPPGLVLMSEQLIQSHGLLVRGTFIDQSSRRPKKKAVAASTRTCKSNPRCCSVGSVVDLSSELHSLDRNT